MSQTTREIKRLSTDLGTDPFGGIISALNRHGSFTHNFGSIADGDTASEAVDVSDEHESDDALEAGDEVLVTIEDEQEDGLVLAAAEVTDDDEITVTVLNVSGGSVDPAEMTFHFFAPLTLSEL